MDDKTPATEPTLTHRLAVIATVLMVAPAALLVVLCLIYLCVVMLHLIFQIG